MPTAIKNVPTVSELVDQIEREDGVAIPIEVAQRIWDSASTRREFAGSTGTSERTDALINRIDVDFVTEAIERQESLSEALEREDPTETERDMSLGVDAFQRVMRGLNIRTASSRNAGVRAHTMGDLDVAGPRIAGDVNVGRCMVPELLRRAYIEGQRFGTQRFSIDRFYASSAPLSEVLEPKFMLQLMTTFKFRQPILNLLVAIETGVEAGVFKYVFIDEQADAERMARVPLGADLPTSKLTVSDREGRVYQYGRAIEAQDAALRRMTIDMVRFQTARLGQRNALDKEEVAVDTAINGDSNAGTAATETDITTVGGIVDRVTSTPLFNFLGLFEESGAYTPTICLARRTTKTKIRSAVLDDGAASPAPTEAAPVFMGDMRLWPNGGEGPEERDHPPIYARSYTPADKGVYIDASQAIGLAFEVGANKTETDRYIKRLVNVVAISEVVGFWVVDSRATRIFDITN
ncbi:MAG: hypothetical protein IT341_07005 [Chloroflexi bacterium]|nr:hypothetical protein [Chloroflexota bacterium]